MNSCWLCLVLHLHSHISKHPALSAEKDTDRRSGSCNELEVSEHKDAAVAKTNLAAPTSKKTNCHALHGQDAEK